MTPCGAWAARRSRLEGFCRGRAVRHGADRPAADPKSSAVSGCCGRWAPRTPWPSRTRPSPALTNVWRSSRSRAEVSNTRKQKTSPGRGMFFVSELFGQCFVQAHAVEVLGRAAGAAAAGTGAGARTGAAAGARRHSGCRRRTRLRRSRRPGFRRRIRRRRFWAVWAFLRAHAAGTGPAVRPAGYHRWLTNTYRVPKPPA